MDDRAIPYFCAEAIKEKFHEETRLALYSKAISQEQFDWLETLYLESHQRDSAQAG
ncbi:hypothetical protein D3C76_290780 [compost metagenome]